MTFDASEFEQNCIDHGRDDHRGLAGFVSAGDGGEFCSEPDFAKFDLGHCVAGQSLFGVAKVGDRELGDRFGLGLSAIDVGPNQHRPVAGYARLSGWDADSDQRDRCVVFGQ